MDNNLILPRFYRRFALIFFGLSAAVLIFIGYLIWARVEIIIIPVQEELEQEFTVEVKDSAAASAKLEFISGKIKEVELTGSDFFSPTGISTSTKGGGSADIGEVTIINNYSKDQTLVASTRLADPASPDKVLARLASTVVVLAGEKVNAKVYTDNPGDFKDIAPMRFVIPGLWQPLQEKIYAENETKLSKTSSTGGTLVLAADLENAKTALKEKLYTQALAEFGNDLSVSQSLWPKLIQSQNIDVSYDAKAGDQVTRFSATINLKAVAVAFDENQMLTLAKEKFKSNLPNDRQLSKIEAGDLSYEITGYNLDQKTAQIKVKAVGRTVIGENIDFLNKNVLLGKTEEQIKNYFSSYAQVKSVEVNFYPSWLRKTPRIQDKINIEIK